MNIDTTVNFNFDDPRKMFTKTTCPHINHHLSTSQIRKLQIRIFTISFSKKLEFETDYITAQWRF